MPVSPGFRVSTYPAASVLKKIKATDFQLVQIFLPVRSDGVRAAYVL